MWKRNKLEELSKKGEGWDLTVLKKRGEGANPLEWGWINPAGNKGVIEGSNVGTCYPLPEKMQLSQFHVKRKINIKHFFFFRGG